MPFTSPILKDQRNFRVRSLKCEKASDAWKPHSPVDPYSIPALERARPSDATCVTKDLLRRHSDDTVTIIAVAAIRSVIVK